MSDRDKRIGATVVWTAVGAGVGVVIDVAASMDGGVAVGIIFVGALLGGIGGQLRG
jgi:hypothetical protein